MLDANCFQGFNVMLLLCFGHKTRFAGVACGLPHNLWALNFQNCGLGSGVMQKFIGFTTTTATNKNTYV